MQQFLLKSPIRYLFQKFNTECLKPVRQLARLTNQKFPWSNFLFQAHAGLLYSALLPLARVLDLSKVLSCTGHQLN